METILLKILEVQNEILAELRLLRRAVTGQQPIPAEASGPLDTAPPAPQPITPQPTVPEAHPTSAPAAAAAPPRQSRQSQPGGMLTLNELTDLGGQFLEPDQRPRGRVKTVDASDLSGSILDDIKAKNKAKRSSFADFEKFGRDR